MSMYDDLTISKSEQAIRTFPYRDINLLGLLAGVQENGEQRDFLIRNNGDQVKIDELIGKTVGVYYTAAWCCPSRKFTPKLVEAYRELSAKTAKAGFEIVYVSQDEDEETFNEFFSEMPWLAVPYSDSEGLKRARGLLSFSFLPYLVIFDEEGKQLNTEGRKHVEKHGAKAYPFTPERIQELSNLTP
ncbi:probable nucleoredoxin 1 [Malania oleifera]|uniref:probable nucleoredoxin 1 n=1 Tax=Malania oleifera TaxID=397392 RepID=UPI0025AEB446|nr:probable nucleoredoxin 1 [Malania oleifera]